MEFINDGSTLVLQNKNFEYKVVLEELIKKSGSDVVKVFMESDILIPRVLNVSALREILNLRIPKAKVLDLSDEMLYRLREYENFTEFQLQNLFNEVCNNEEEFHNYLMAFYDKVINNAGLLGITEDNIMRLLILDNKEDNFKDFESELFKITRDYRTYFDGVRIETLREALPNSATTQELRDLGSRYGIIIPKRLRRNEMEKYISDELRKQGKLDDELKERLSKMPVMTLQRMAKNNGIRISADLKKEDVINYLLEDAAKLTMKPMKKVNLVGLESDFEFKLSYVDTTEDNKAQALAKAIDSNDAAQAQNTALLKELISEVNSGKAAKPVETRVSEVHVDNTETNELLRDLIQEVQASKPAEAQTVVTTNTAPLIDDEAKGLLRELISEIRKSNEKEIKVEAAPVEAPQVNIVNQIDTDALVDSISKLNIGSTREVVREVVEAKPAVAAIEKVEEPINTEPQIKDNPYMFDNFTNQVNPYYDANLADMIVANPEAVELAAHTKLTKLEKKETKLQEKLDQKASKQELKKQQAEEAKQAKLDLKQSKLENKQYKKQNKNRIKDAKKRQQQMEAAVKSGKIYDVDNAELQNYIRIKEFNRALKMDKRDRHRDRMSHLGTFFKVLFLIIVLLAITWLVFALLFTFDQCLGMKDWLDNNGFNWLFGGIVDAFKSMFGK